MCSSDLHNPECLPNDQALEYHVDQSLRSIMACANQYDLTLLLHSEQHSDQLQLFVEHGFVPVYYWSHGLIAQDWFRYAQHDPRLVFDFSQITKDFLVYNRAWGGTREYRLYFTQSLYEHNLLDHVQTTFNPRDQVHYTRHIFKNQKFQISNYNLEQCLQPCLVDSTASADYNNIDYANAGIEVVLETIFDDTRWHLTEKILRPIACGKPFILASTPGSLEYLRNYGFKTFQGLIDESYDQISDSSARLHAIILEMKRIAALDSRDKLDLYKELHEIAKYNKQIGRAHV